MDIAALGLKVETKQLKDGTVVLTKFEKKAEDAAQAIEAYAASQRRAATATTKTTQAIELNGFQAQNMAYQMNDVVGGAITGVQDLSTIILQQGTQMIQMFGPQVGVAAAVKTMGKSLLSFVANPLTLTLLGVAAATKAIELLWDAVGASENAEEAMERFQEYIDDTLHGYEDLQKAAQDYIDTAKKLPSAAVLSRTTKDLEKDIESFNEKVREMRLQFSSPNPRTRYGFDTSEFEQMFEQLKTGEITAKELQKLLAELTINEDAERGARSLAESFADTAAELAIIQARIDSLSNTAGKITANRSGAIINVDFDDLEKQLEDKAREEARKNRAASRARRPEDQIKKVINALTFELEQLDRTNIEQEVYNQLKRAGVDINSVAGDQIATLVRQIESEKEALEQAAEASEFLKDTFKDGVLDIIDGSASASDAIKDMTRQLQRAALEAALFGSGPLGQGGGGVLGNVVGDFLKIFRASGGTVQGGSSYVVGEQGPEIFTPLTSGNITPNHALKAANSNGTPQVKIEIINFTGAPIQTQEQQLNGQMIKKIVIGTMNEHAARGGLNPALRSSNSIKQR